MNDVYFVDTATLAFQPIIDLSESPFANLSCQAAIHWLNQDCTPSNWGGFMNFYGPTRILLKAGGLNLEDKNFLKLKSTNPKWIKLVEKYLKGDLTNKEKLYFVRLLYYMGFYQQGVDVCQTVLRRENDIENVYWSLYLKELGESIQNPLEKDFSSFITLILTTEEKLSPLLTFHIYMLITKFYIRQKKDEINSKFWLDKIELLINDELFKQLKNCALGIGRFYKYQAEYFLLLKNNINAKKTLLLAKDILEKGFKLVQKDSSSSYLFFETKRRVLDAIYFICIKDEPQEAYRYAKESSEIDPFCSYNHSLIAEASKNFNSEDCKLSFEKASHFGVIERSYAKTQLDSNKFSNHQNVFLISQTKDAKNLYKLPIEINSLEKISNDLNLADSWDEMKKLEAYQRFLPFWSLENSSSLTSPVFCKGPLVALEAFQSIKSPWFSTTYLQRAMTRDFREELFFTISPHENFAQLNIKEGSSLNVLKNSSRQANEIFSMLPILYSFSKLEQIQFCRLLGSLGFYGEAIKRLPMVDKNCSWNLEDEYAYCTELFFEHIEYDGLIHSLNEKIEFTYHKLSFKPESIRMRLTLTMLGVVYYAKQKNVPLINLWKERGHKELERMHNCSEFDNFEKKLLTSRFYRAVSFYSFLINDLYTLKQEAEKCETLARNLKKENNSELQNLLFRENQIPMLESMSRIYDKLGESARALNLMEEIVKNIDGNDSKAWIQVGELREKNGNIEGALQAYLKAAELALPMGNIAWYKAGRTYEKIGLPKFSIDCYLNSLKCCPKGISPLKRIHEISFKMNDSYLKAWSELNLNSLQRLLKH